MADGDRGDPSLPRVLVDDRQAEPLDLEDLVGLARMTLVGEGAADAELSLSFVTEDEIAELQARYLGEDGPTDVLSFPIDEADEDGVRILGDVVVAPSVAARNHPDDPAGEVRLLLVHGILHLLGHDHEDDAGRAEMWGRQQRYAGVPTASGAAEEGRP